MWHRASRSLDTSHVEEFIKKKKKKKVGADGSVERRSHSAIFKRPSLLCNRFCCKLREREKKNKPALRVYARVALEKKREAEREKGRGIRGVFASR